eukprot:Skav232239  [mRNA]  locus=scaffold273:33340:33819:+ [translate_table: standard]
MKSMRLKKQSWLPSINAHSSFREPSPLFTSEKFSDRKKSRCLLRQSHNAVAKPSSTMLSIKAFLVFSLRIGSGLVPTDTDSKRKRGPPAKHNSCSAVKSFTTIRPPMCSISFSKTTRIKDSPLNFLDDCRPAPTSGRSLIIRRETAVRIATRFVCGCFL